ncbi:MAG: hypothetical protein ACXVPQ_09425, partial [Bacteroidia bacterium]
MAGFKPRQAGQLSLRDQDPAHFLAVAHEAAIKMGWKITYLSASGFAALSKPPGSSAHEEIRMKINGLLANIRSETVGDEMVDWGRNKENVDTFIGVFDELKKDISTEHQQIIYDKLKPHFASEDTLTLPSPTIAERASDFLKWFVPVKGFVVTPILLDLNIAVFIIMVCAGVSVFEPDSGSLLAWGANLRPATLSGQW